VAMLPPRVSEAPLTFTNHRSEKVSELDFRGQHSIVFFGYSSCPDVCPGNLIAMTRAMALLGDAASLVQPLFVSFDPAHDTPEVLSTYVTHFDSRLIGLTGSDEEIEAATKAYGVYFELAKNEKEGSGREIHHTSNTFFLGPDGNAISIFRHNTEPEEMAGVMRSALATWQAEGAKEVEPLNEKAAAALGASAQR
jgi:protein SCO1/2